MGRKPKITKVAKAAPRFIIEKADGVCVGPDINVLDTKNANAPKVRRLVAQCFFRDDAEMIAIALNVMDRMGEIK